VGGFSQGGGTFRAAVSRYKQPDSCLPKLQAAPRWLLVLGLTLVGAEGGGLFADGGAGEAGEEPVQPVAVAQGGL